MRTLRQLIPAALVGGLCCLPAAAQQTASQPAPDIPVPNQPGVSQGVAAQQSSAAAVPVPSTANAPEVNNPDLRPVSGELVSKIDSKDAKPGDPVVIRTTEEATVANGVVIPKGSKIVGHVTDVQAQDSKNPNAKLMVQFDKAEIKGGQTLAIKTVLQSVAPTGSTGDSLHGGAMTAAQPGVSTAAAKDGNRAGTVVARQGNVQVKTTSIPGVLLASDADGQPFANASGAIVGASQNVHLDGGTQVTLGIAPNAKATNER